jgi:hypothetical protein
VPPLCELYPGICLTIEEKKHGKTSVRVVGECQLAKNIQNRTYMSIRIHKCDNKNNMMCPDDKVAKIKK